jgi:hypothetical protein
MGPYWIGWGPIQIGWGPIRIGWGPIQIGWGLHLLQPSLPSHRLIYIHCFTPSLTGDGSFFIQRILIHCRFVVIVLVGIVIVGSLLL